MAAARLSLTILAEPVRLALEGERPALHLLVVLELDLEEPDELQADAGHARDRRSPRTHRCGTPCPRPAWMIMFPAVARRSPAITTPRSQAAATIVVACGRLLIISLAASPAAGADPGREIRSAAGPARTR